MKNKLVIIGCGGHARSVADVYLFNNPDAEIIFVDDSARDEEIILGCPVVKDYSFNGENVFVAIGECQKRAKEISKYSYIEKIISSNAYLGKDVEFAQGVFVAHKAHIGVGSKIGEGTIINTSASIDHEVEIGKYCHIAPSSTICGRSKIGDIVFVGAGATIIDKISICDDVIIGAGAVVVQNIEESGTYVGNPARKIK